MEDLVVIASFIIVGSVLYYYTFAQKQFREMWSKHGIYQKWSDAPMLIIIWFALTLFVSALALPIFAGYRGNMPFPVSITTLGRLFFLISGLAAYTSYLDYETGEYYTGDMPGKPRTVTSIFVFLVGLSLIALGVYLNPFLLIVTLGFIVAAIVSHTYLYK